MTLSNFLRPVVTADESETASEVARKLRDRRVGCVVVTRARRVYGIMTDRDIVVRVVAEGLDPATTRVADIVTHGPVVASQGDELQTVIARMRTHGIRRVPIVNGDGEAVGIVTADDVMMLLGRELGQLGEAIAESADSCDCA